jgi:exodeoxyribonuclease VII large subunit
VITLSVSEINTQIKAALEPLFAVVSVRGEIGRITRHSSGHIYFTIKDEKSALECALFRSNAARLKFQLESGMRIIAAGSLSVYIPQGRYTFNCSSIEPDGAGSLALAFEQLKKKLGALGWFDRKRALPTYPKSVVFVTSATGAVLQDMLRVAEKRWALARFVCVNTLVQGEKAAAEIAASIRFADTLKASAIVLARGGGSQEDLWCFNDEDVARAIFECSTPVISAVGHEIDFVISDFVADVRAPTPSAAMEMLLPDKTDELMRIGSAETRLVEIYRSLLMYKEGNLKHFRAMLSRHSLEMRFDRVKSEIKALNNALAAAFGFFIRARQSEIVYTQSRLAALEPAKRLAPKTAQIVKNGIVIEAKELRKEEEFELLDASASVRAVALDVTPADLN